MISAGKFWWLLFGEFSWCLLGFWGGSSWLSSPFLGRAVAGYVLLFGPEAQGPRKTGGRMWGSQQRNKFGQYLSIQINHYIFKSDFAWRTWTHYLQMVCFQVNHGFVSGWHTRSRTILQPKWRCHLFHFGCLKNARGSVRFKLTTADCEANFTTMGVLEAAHKKFKKKDFHTCPVSYCLYTAPIAGTLLGRICV